MRYRFGTARARTAVTCPTFSMGEAPRATVSKYKFGNAWRAVSVSSSRGSDPSVDLQAKIRQILALLCQVGKPTGPVAEEEPQNSPARELDRPPHSIQPSFPPAR
jgi:hypothetical protein